MSGQLEFAIDTFGDVTFGSDGKLLSQAQVIRNVVAEGVLADQVGLDFFGVGEHHRADFAVTAPEMVLAAIAAKTNSIKLGSAVTVLSSDDPIRVFQRFSTLDAISNGRAEVVLGRGSFIESFPLFGLDLKDYEVLFEEKLDLFTKLLPQTPVTWRGKTRPPLTNVSVYPPVEHGSLKTWIGVGGSPNSAVRAAHYGLPLMLAIIGGAPKRFLPFVQLYRDSLADLGKPHLPVGLHSHGYIADTEQQAREDLFPHWKAMRDRIGGERGWGAASRDDFETEVVHGSMYAGTPETVAKRIATTAQILGISRFSMKYSSGSLPHDKLMRSIELYGTKVVPMVRDMMASTANTLLLQ